MGNEKPRVVGGNFLFSTNSFFHLVREGVEPKLTKPLHKMGQVPNVLHLIHLLYKIII